MLERAARLQFAADDLAQIDVRDLHLSATVRLVDDANDHRAALHVVLQVDVEIERCAVPDGAAKLPKEAVRPEYGEIVSASVPLPGIAEGFSGLDRVAPRPFVCSC